jgi:hypothetical protein
MATLREFRDNIARTCTSAAVSGDGHGAIANPNIDRSIRWAGNRFLSETKCVRTTGTKATVSGTATIDPSTMTDFLPGTLLTPPYISSENRRLWTVDFSALLNKRNLSDVQGVPEMIAFLSDTVAHLYPTPDAIYTLTFHYWRPLAATGATAFTIGMSDDSISLNVPERYVDAVCIGASAHLTRSYPGIPGGEAKFAEFERAIHRAKGEVTAGGVYFSDESEDWDNSYALNGRI